MRGPVPQLALPLSPHGATAQAKPPSQQTAILGRPRFRGRGAPVAAAMSAAAPACRKKEGLFRHPNQLATGQHSIKKSLCAYIKFDLPQTI